MAIAINATDAFSAGGSSTKATSATGTIPSGAGIGDVIFMVFQASNTGTNSGTAPTLSVTSTGSTWTQIGSTEAVSIASFAHNWSSIWWVKVAAADQGATVTVHSTTSYYLAAAAAGYSGVNGTSPVDAFNFNVTTAGEETWPFPTVTAGASTDWLLYLAAVTSDVTMVSVTKPSTCTLRESYFAYNEVYCGIADLNATVAAGTVGGASWTCGAYSGFIGWTVAISAGSAGTNAPAGLATGGGASQATDLNTVVSPAGGLATGGGTSQGDDTNASFATLTGPAGGLATSGGASQGDDTNASFATLTGPAGGLAAGTSTALQAGGQATGLATGGGTSQGDDTNASFATLTGPAASLATGGGASQAGDLNNAVSPAAGLAGGTGAAQQAGAQGAAPGAGGGTAQPPASSLSTGAALATGAGAASPVTIGSPGNAPAGPAAGAGTALQAVAQGTGLSSGAGSAQAPAVSLSPGSGLAAGTGAAPQAGGQNAGLAAGTGTAPQAGGQNAGLATGGGASQAADLNTIVGVSAGLATGGGASQAADLNTIAGVSAGPANGTGAAQALGGQVVITAGLASAAGSAPPPGQAQAGLAAGTGTAPQEAGHNAVLASATGTGEQASFEFTMVPARLATGGGAAQATDLNNLIIVNAGLAAGTGMAPDASVPAGHLGVTGRIHGKSGVAYLSPNYGDVASPIAFLSGWTVSWTLEDQVDVTGYTDPQHIYIALTTVSSGSFTGWFDTATVQTYQAAVDGLPRTFYLYPDTANPGQFFSGEVLPDFSVGSGSAAAVAIAVSWESAAPVLKSGEA